LAAAFKKDVPSIEKMLRRSRTLVKPDVGQELAGKYKALIEKAGGQCELVPHGQVASPQLDAAPKSYSLALEPIAKPKVDAEQEDEDDNSDSACYCVKCGTVIRVGQTKCPKCFTPVSEFVSKNKTTAALLAFFVGGLGVHRLYLGQWWGIIYLLFWGTLIPSIVSLIESIVFLASSQESWDRKYGNVQKTSGVMAAVFVVSIVFFIAITGILAAVALPAYQDYVNRSKIVKAMPVVDEAREKVSVFIKKNHSYPSENIVVGLSDEISSDVIESIHLQNNANLEVTYRLGLKDKSTIIWAPKEVNGEVQWSCDQGSLPDKYRPKECRGGGERQPVVEVTAKEKSAITESQLFYSDNKSVSILVPDSWKTEDLVPGALISVAKKGDETYAVVLADSKVDFDKSLTLDAYTDLIQKQLVSVVKNGDLVSSPKNMTISNLPAKQFLYQGSVEGVKIGYVITLIESDDNFYRVLTWTLQSRLEKNKELLKNIGESVRIVK
jgi:TM2 domain-containing membrane protein YozV/Tfp pilus assembly major pilin PilA